MPFFGLSVLLASSVFGYYSGFTKYGPDYRHYIQEIEDYALHNLKEPGLKPLYPPQPPDKDMDVRLTLFLAAHGHQLFGKMSPPKNVAPLPAEARVLVDGAERARPVEVSSGNKKISWLTALLPADTKARGVQARIGGATVTLWRVSSLNAPEACHMASTVCFMGALVPHLLPAGARRLEFSMFE